MKIKIIIQLAGITRELHNLPTAPFFRGPVIWNDFIDNQITDIVKNHKNHGLEGPLLDQITDYVTSELIDFKDERNMVPLHTELMKEHILVDPDSGKITGLIDYEPSMIGHFEYEFPAVGIFISGGDRKLFKLFLESYGFAQSELNPKLSRRIMILLLLHRYSNLNWFMSLFQIPKKITKLGQLEELWFAL